jgi:hypothetical protein
MRLLRAFAWLRWRLLANTLRAAERRDMIERVSRVTALVAPGLLAATSVSSVAAAIGFGAMAGWSVVLNPLQSGWVVPTIRVLLLLVTVFAVFIPLFVGMHGGAARLTRLLLLPIPRRTLLFVEVVSGLADPWLVFVLPGLVAFGGGMIAAGLAGSAAAPWDGVLEGGLALLAAAGITMVLVSLGALVAFLVSWVVRDRRRSELFVVVLVLALTVVSLVPAALSVRVAQPTALPATLARARSLPARPLRLLDRLPAWTTLLPSELYADAVTPRVGLGPAGAGASIWSEPGWLALAGLFGEGIVLYGLSAAVHRRLLESAEGARASRTRSVLPVVSPTLPGMWPGTSAVAVAQARTALRSVRGRLVVLLPGPLVGMFAVLFQSLGAGDVIGPLVSQSHLLLAGGIVLGLYAAQPFTMNQFGSDRAGLTLEFLAPIRDVDLIRGKAVGCGAIIGAGVLISLACVLLAAPVGSPLLWLATLAGGLATYLVLSPLAAWFSVWLPVAADLSKTGAGGNPHTLAMLAGMVFVALASTPAAVILASLPPSGAFLAMIAWLAIAWAATLPLLSLTARALKARRENLALVAQGR